MPISIAFSILSVDDPDSLGELGTVELNLSLNLPTPQVSSLMAFDSLLHTFINVPGMGSGGINSDNP